MRKVTVYKEEVIDKARENRNNHKNEYEIALKGYKQEMKEYLLQQLGELEASSEKENFSLGSSPTMPRHHLDDYDNAIRMLDWETNEMISLEEHEFKNLIFDEWDWQHSWKRAYNSFSGIDLNKLKP
jgi:hypothetical protein